MLVPSHQIVGVFSMKKTYIWVIRKKNQSTQLGSLETISGPLRVHGPPGLSTPALWTPELSRY